MSIDSLDPSKRAADPSGSPLDEAQLSEFLRAAGKKRKNYGIIAVGKEIDDDSAKLVEKFLQEHFSGDLVVAKISSVPELERFITRQIRFVVIDDSFASVSTNIRIIKRLKRRHHEETIPVLFLTNKPQELVFEYNRHLLAYQETDHYLPTIGLTLARLSEALALVSNRQQVRRSKRFPINLPVKIRLLDGRDLDGELENISLHGALLHSRDHIFRLGEQMKVRIAIYEHLPISLGEFMWLSAKARRVLISGSQIGVSWEHLGEQQIDTLSLFLTRLVRRFD